MTSGCERNPMRTTPPLQGSSTSNQSASHDHQQPVVFLAVRCHGNKIGKKFIDVKYLNPEFLQGTVAKALEERDYSTAEACISALRAWEIGSSERKNKASSSASDKKGSEEDK